MSKDLEQAKVDALVKYKYKLDKVLDEHREVFIDILFTKPLLPDEKARKAEDIFLRMERDIEGLIKDAEFECIEACGNILKLGKEGE